MSADLFELELDFAPPAPKPAPARPTDFVRDILAFRDFGTETRQLVTHAAKFDGTPLEVPTFVNEFWTAKQRQASSLHEVSYRACFKPQLPRFFIERLTQPGDVVYDPFMGRGTTPVEAALLGRVPYGNDINPLSIVFTRPRLGPPTLDAIAARLKEIPFHEPAEAPEDLLVFYHPETLREIAALRKYLFVRRQTGRLELIDEWIALVALNRLTGHSNGFFSVYTLPPNQAVSVVSQRKINEKRKQTPERRDVAALILKKSNQLLGDVDAATWRNLARAAKLARLFTGPADATPDLPSGSVSLAVTSPPFLNVVQYAADNWLRCWFLGLDAQAIAISVPKKLEKWQEVMSGVFRELARVLQPGGHVAF